MKSVLHNGEMSSNKMRRALQVAELIRAGNATPSEILRLVNTDPLIAYTGMTKKAQLKALGRDLERLEGMGFYFEYDKRHARYVETKNDASISVLNLSDQETDVLAQLPVAFHDTSYQSGAISLCARLAKLLPKNQQNRLAATPLLRINTPALEELGANTASARLISRAFRERREITFHYLPPGKKKAYEMRAQILSDLELRDGHVYFDFQSLRSDIQRSYRLSRVVPGSVKLQPRQQAGFGPAPAPVEISYWLSSNLEPTRHFPNGFNATQMENGWVVTAQIDEREIFRVAKILLRYGGNCQALAPIALVDEVRRAVEEMAKRYGLI